TSTALGLQYPVDGDNTYTANILRQYDAYTGVQQVQTTASGPLTVSSTRANDGAKRQIQWSNPSPGGGNTGTLRFTLPETYVIGKFEHEYWDPIYFPSNYEIRVSTTGFDSMTTVRPMGP